MKNLFWLCSLAIFLFSCSKEKSKSEPLPGMSINGTWLIYDCDNPRLRGELFFFSGSEYHVSNSSLSTGTYFVRDSHLYIYQMLSTFEYDIRELTSTNLWIQHDQQFFKCTRIVNYQF
jgi:hypothetical protein